jgi:hypothetical protein
MLVLVCMPRGSASFIILKVVTAWDSSDLMSSLHACDLPCPPLPTGTARAAMTASVSAAAPAARGAATTMAGAGGRPSVGAAASLRHGDCHPPGGVVIPVVMKVVVAAGLLLLSMNQAVSLSVIGEHQVRPGGRGV